MTMLGALAPRALGVNAADRGLDAAKTPTMPAPDDLFTQAEIDFDIRDTYETLWAMKRAELLGKCPLCLTEPLATRCVAYWTCPAYAAACGVKAHQQAPEEPAR